MKTKILCLANEAEVGLQFIGAANAYAIDADGWLTIPYGDTPHSGNDGMAAANAGEKAPKPVIQRFNREDAIALVNDFKSTWSRFKRAVVGLPIFKGHPDAPRYAKKFPDKIPRGQIADMEAGENGLRIKPVLSEQGAEDVTGGWSETSPYWALRVTSETPEYRYASPFKLFSLGLVPKGNIQGLSLTNAAEPQNENENMNPLLIKLLAALGITLAANASESEAKTALEQALPKINAANAAETELPTVKSKVTALEGQVSTLTTAKTKAEGEVVTLTNEKNSLTTRATTAEETFRTERKARALVVVNNAVTSGRVAGSARDAEVLSLANAADFDAAATALNARARVLKTSGNLDALSTAAVNTADRTQQILSLVNSAMEAPGLKGLPEGERYDAAFALVRKDPKNAAFWPEA